MSSNERIQKRKSHAAGEEATPFRIRFYAFLRSVLIGFLLASLLNLVLSLFFYTPKMYGIEERKGELLLKYEVLNDKVEAATARLAELQHRDREVYRSFFGVDTLSLHGVDTPYPAQKYAHLDEDRYTGLMTDTWMGLDAMSRTLYQSSKSLDELELLALNKEVLAEAIPAIWPMDKRLMRGGIGAFGTRRHPISFRIHRHTGIDLGGRIGTPIYATGDGVVMADPHAGRGYGIQVLVDHGFGYVTRYAHLNKALVEPGQRVKRGEIIGELGNTGRSTGPHLHYEVIYRGIHVDPLNFFSRDMSEEEFAAIIESAKETTYEADQGTGEALETDSTTYAP